MLVAFHCCFETSDLHEIYFSKNISFGKTFLLLKQRILNSISIFADTYAGFVERF